MIEIDPPEDWQPLKTSYDWQTYRGGVLVIHEHTLPFDEVATKFHGRGCRHVRQGNFTHAVISGADDSEWFHAPNAASARRGGAVPCLHCGGG